VPWDLDWERHPGKERHAHPIDEKSGKHAKEKWTYDPKTKKGYSSPHSEKNTKTTGKKIKKKDRKDLEDKFKEGAKEDTKRGEEWAPVPKDATEFSVKANPNELAPNNIPGTPLEGPPQIVSLPGTPLGGNPDIQPNTETIPAFELYKISKPWEKLYNTNPAQPDNAAPVPSDLYYQGKMASMVSGMGQVVGVVGGATLMSRISIQVPQRVLGYVF